MGGWSFRSAPPGSLVVIVGPIIGLLANGDWPTWSRQLFRVNEDVAYPGGSFGILGVPSPALRRHISVAPIDSSVGWVVTISGLS